MKLPVITLSIALATSFLIASSAQARNFPYKRSVTLKVGQSTILKGVRSRDCGPGAPSWAKIRNGLPRTKLGKFSDGGAGTTKSNRCGKRVGARGIMFTATKPGKERLNIYKDAVSITVK